MLKSGHREQLQLGDGVTSRAVNQQVPAFSDCVEISWTEGRGRYSTVQYIILQYITVQRSTMRYNTVQYSVV